jgi:3-deoxy-manno-octulosonate cytidylyltransferase (CMP-KDO synthetase)
VNAIGIIPSRFASTRFPGKPLVDIGGKPMIQRVYEQAIKAKSLAKVFVATDDARIYNVVTTYGGRAIMTSELCTNGTERCAEALEKLNVTNTEVMVNIQGDEPFVQPLDIDNLVACFQDDSVQISTLVKRFTSPEDFQNPSKVKAWVNNEMMAERFTRTPDDTSMNNPLVYHHVGLYAFRLPVLQQLIKLPATENELRENLEQVRWLDNAYKIKCVVTEHEALSVDTPEDLERIQQQMHNLF